MIKCLECGKEVNRIQWTHLRYKCTGKFKTCEEYMNAYPGAITVDTKVSKRSALTKENFILKYGETEGEIRWDQYRERQSYSNSFEYKRDRHGWTKEKFDEFNSSRAITLEKCIDRYGEKEGLKRWTDYCEKQAYTNTKEYFVKKYGSEDGIKKYITYNKQKGTSNSPKAISEKLNISIEQATELLLSRSNFNKLGSKLEKEFTEMLETRIGKLEYTTFTRPYGKWSNDMNSYVIYDIKHKDCVIEFNGDYWHCNPKLYESNDKAFGNKTAYEIWEKDRRKVQTAIDSGFRVMIVWESEFRKNKIETIERVIQWMQSGQK